MTPVRSPPVPCPCHGCTSPSCVSTDVLCCFSVVFPNSGEHETSHLEKELSVLIQYLDTTSSILYSHTREILLNLTKETIGKNRKSKPVLVSVCIHASGNLGTSAPAMSTGKAGWTVSPHLKVKSWVHCEVLLNSCTSEESFQNQETAHNHIWQQQDNKGLTQQPRTFSEDLGF